MRVLISLIKNHVFSNLVFVLIMFLGFYTYNILPREQDPNINFNWIQITTFYPGASAEDVEKKVTDKLEEAIETIADIKFAQSNSRENLSSILVRFQDLDDEEFEERLSDLRREIQNVEDQLPDEVIEPRIFEVTSANAFPSAMVLVHANSEDEILRRVARDVRKDLARIRGVDQVQPTGEYDPEIHVLFEPERLEAAQITPLDIANTISTYLRDLAVGSVQVANDQWLIRVAGSTTDPDVIAKLPIINTLGKEVLLADVAQVIRAREKADRLVSYEGRPGVLLSVMKSEGENTIELVARIKRYVEEQQPLLKAYGVDIILADDQTIMTKNALNVMETNAVYGLILVFLVSWLFLGLRISAVVTIGIPFILAGTFILVYLFGQTLNTMVFLGIVIALGMLVDDAVVIMESIYDKLRFGGEKFQSIVEGLEEVIAPVTASVLTTMAVMTPLILLPGILGKFMMVVPLVVTSALAISLVEAYWMLPGHVYGMKNIGVHDANHHRREDVLRKLRNLYGRWVLVFLRRPKASAVGMLMIIVVAASMLAMGAVKFDFFASDTIRLFYVNIELDRSASLEATMSKTNEIERTARQFLKENEIRSVVSYAGQQFTETAPLFADNLGQILVSLMPEKGDDRTVEEIIESMREAVEATSGIQKVSFLKLAGGPPVSKPLSVKVRGNDYDVIRAATDALTRFIVQDGRFKDISDDDSPGRYGLALTLDKDAIRRSGLSADAVRRTISMMVDGVEVTSVQENGEEVGIRVQSATAKLASFDDVNDVIDITLPLPSGGQISLTELVHQDIRQVKGNIFHYNFKRAITLESDIDDKKIDTVQANDLIKQHWQTIAVEYPGVDLDFSGQLDDINESIEALAKFLVLGIGLIYLVLATQFRSYWQPFMIILSVPFAIAGVVFGLFATANPMSLFTLFGALALVGMAVNASIVLISKANDNLEAGMTLVHAIFYAARRRMLPIIITTLTTVAGLLSLATGLGGYSLMWSPIATAIVSGLIFSSLLTMFFVPVVYLSFMKNSKRVLKRH